MSLGPLWIYIEILIQDISGTSQSLYFEEPRGGHPQYGGLLPACLRCRLSPTSYPFGLPCSKPSARKLLFSHLAGWCKEAAGLR